MQTGRLLGIVAAAAAAFAVATDAFAHGYEVRLASQSLEDGIAILPGPIPGPPFSARFIEMRKGDKLVLRVIDLDPDPGCRALITSTNVLGQGFTVTPDSSMGLVRNRDFRIDAVTAGGGEFTIHVEGEGLHGGDAGCSENSDNLFIVVVTEDPAVAEAAASKAVKTDLKGLKARIGDALSALRPEVLGVRNEFREGALTAPAAGWGLFNGYFGATKELCRVVDEGVRDIRSDLAGILSAGKFPVGCQPRLFGVGSGGPWDLGLSASASYQDDALGKLRASLGKDLKGFEKLLSTPAEPFRLNGVIPRMSLPRVLPPTTSTEFTEYKGDGLQMLFLGAASTLESNAPAGYVWCAGCAETDQGELSIEVHAADGTKVSVQFPVLSDGTWTILVEDVPTGMEVRVRVQYVDEQYGYGDKSFISTPKVAPILVSKK